MFDLTLEGVSKRYFLRSNGGSPGRWRGPFAKNSAEMWALRDVSFKVSEGEALGIVGHNGAGKTTLLKLLSRITAPTKGRIEIHGRLAALIEVGSGFHPELTGRENVYLHGAMLGMRRNEITEKMDSIIAFSGLEKYIDVPVKRYSSGMYVRLGFSVAAHLEPDIVLLDEVLAVGDVAFQAKCLERISALREAGRTIVFVSHDLASVYRLCDRAILLHHGCVVMDGPPRTVVDEYVKLAFSDGSASDGSPSDRMSSDRSPHESQLRELQVEDIKAAHCLSVSFSSPDSFDSVRTGYPMVASISYQSDSRIPDAVFRISLYWPSGYLCAQLTNESSGPRLSLEPGRGTVEFHCPVLPVVPGLYRIDVGIEINGREIDVRQRCAMLRVDDGKPVSGDFYIENAWSIRNDSTQAFDAVERLEINPSVPPRI
jgi:ABC-type polysaccharide/polyol phosphate transport system ATPase subunit